MPLDPFRAAVFQALDAYVQSVIEENNNRTGEVIHYTSVDGLIGILGSGKLFAGNLIAMNDASEMVHSKEILLSYLSKLSIAEQDNRVIVERVRQRISEEEPPRAFVASFTGKQDATTHWQGYAGTSGFALHFDKEKLTRQAKAKGYFAGYCVYNKDVQGEFITNTFLKAFAIYRKVATAQGQVSVDLHWVAEAILYALGRIAPLVKSDAFSHEDEWRCWNYVRWNGEVDDLDLSEVEFHNKCGILTGRMRLDLGINAGVLKKITVGPSPYQGINHMTAQALLHKCRLFGVEVVRSDSPLRHL